MDEELTRIVELVKTTVRYARTAERLRHTLGTLRYVVADIGDVEELENGVGPELLAALDHINEAASALARAATVIETRFDLEVEGELPPPSEGGLS